MKNVLVTKINSRQYIKTNIFNRGVYFIRTYNVFRFGGSYSLCQPSLFSFQDCFLVFNVCFWPVVSSQELNLAVVGSQIVGIVPLKALMDAAEYYMKKDNLFILEEDQKLRLVREMALTEGSWHKNGPVTLLQQLASLI